MARTWRRDAKQNNGWVAAFGVVGVVLFMMEISALLNYVEARFAEITPNFLGGFLAWGVATWKLVESTFWNYGQLEATFRIVPFVALPFVMLGLSLAMKGTIRFRRQQDSE